MYKNKLTIWILVLIVSISGYLNYFLFSSSKTFRHEKMNDVSSTYIVAHSSVVTINDYGYKALATNDISNLHSSFNIIKDEQARLQTAMMLGAQKSYISNFEVRRVSEGLNYLSRQVINEVIKTGWTEELREEFELYLRDYDILRKHYREVLELDFNSAYFNKLVQIELNIVSNLNKYVNYYSLLQEEFTNREEVSEKIADYEYNEQTYMKKINEFSPEAIEYAKNYMSILIPDYESKGYGLIGVTGHGYSVSPPIHTVSVSFKKPHKYGRADADVIISLTLDGAFHSMSTSYSKSGPTGFTKHDSEKDNITNINVTVEDAIELTRKRIKDLLLYIDDVAVESIQNTNGRLFIVYNLVIDESIKTNLNVQAAVALDDGRIESLQSSKDYSEDIEFLINQIRNFDKAKLISEENARKGIGPQNKIMGSGNLYYRYNYGRPNEWLWRFEVQTGQRKQWIYIDAFSGKEINIESAAEWDF